MSRTPLTALTVAMAKGFVRDRMSVFWAVIFPLMFLVLFGGLLTDRGMPRSEVVEVGPVALLDDLPADARTAVEEALELRRSTDLDAALADLRDGDIDAVLTQSGDRVVLHVSAADQVASAQVQGTVRGIVEAANQAATGQPPALTLVPRQVEDESLETIQYVTPGLLGWAVAMSATFGAAVNLVAWRRNGLLRRLRLAPVPVRSVVLARVGVSLVVALAQAAIFLALGVVAFGLTLTGWWPLVVPLLVAGTLAFLSIGLLAGAVSRTEEGAVGLANIVVLPMAFLSGSFFPLDGTPGWLQTLSRALPLRHLNDGMTDVMVRGDGPGAVVLPLAVLLGFTVVVATVAARLFRWDV